MKPKPYEAQNTKFSEYERSSLISSATFEIQMFENQTSVIIKISRFSGHRSPGINEGVFGFSLYTSWAFFNLLLPTIPKGVLISLAQVNLDFDWKSVLGFGHAKMR